MYNNYNNPYLNNYYPYQGSQTQQPNYSQPNMNQIIQPQAPMVTYTPLTFVNGIEGAKAFMPPTNSTVYLRDSDSDKLYVKSSDSQGKLSMKVFKLVEVDENGNPKEDPKIADNRSLDNYITKDYMKTFETKLEEKLSKLHNKIDNFTMQRKAIKEER